MSLLPAIRHLFTMQPAPVPARTERAFVTGPATVDQSQTYFGIDNQTYQPQEYANYIATSNGVYACVSLRARTLAHLPLKVYRVTASGGKQEITSGPLWQLLQKVNPYWTAPRLFDMTEQSLCTWGAAYWFLEKRGRTPVELWWARPDRVKVHPHPTEYISHFTYQGPGGREIRFERDETIWFRYPNVADQYSGLSPMAAARLAADTSSAAMHSNFNIFRNGVQMAGVLVPKQGTNLTPEQAQEIATAMDKRFRGVDKAHRLGVLRYEIDVKTLSLTPKDAEFLGALNWSLEDIARAFNVPIDKIGGKRTYQNVGEAEAVFWTDCMRPEAQFIANEITEQLLPMFGENLLAEFDLSEISALQEAESEVWAREREQLDRGAITINEWRTERGMDPVDWGDVVWLQSTLMPIDSSEKPEPVLPALPPGQQPNDQPPDQQTPPPAEDSGRSRHLRAIAYGSEEHQRLWNRFVQQTEPWERVFHRTLREQLLAQQSSVLARLRKLRVHDARAPIADLLDEETKQKLLVLADDPFDKPRFTKASRVALRPVVADITASAGNAALEDLGVITAAFNVKDPNVMRAIEQQTQRFSVSVTDTTWETLRTDVRAGIDAGEGIDVIAQRVERVMGDRITSSAHTIARTEVHLASNQGTLDGWRQSGVVSQKQWLAALDERTRESHVVAHGQTVDIDEEFDVGECSGPAPGLTDCPEEDINCRCAMTALLDVQGAAE